MSTYLVRLIPGFTICRRTKIHNNIFEIFTKNHNLLNIKFSGEISLKANVSRCARHEGLEKNWFLRGLSCFYMHGKGKTFGSYAVSKSVLGNIQWRKDDEMFHIYPYVELETNVLLHLWLFPGWRGAERCLYFIPRVFRFQPYVSLYFHHGVKATFSPS